ncbi:MAG: zinc ribbon domain-containing protein [Phycisphaerales bacterium]|nr:MAG: zinc ribbon domain-containing protein [Phycisphaerales bacterium]
MPTYEYECTKCGRVFEEFQSITAKPLKVIPCRCETCGNRAPVIRRIGTGGGIIFKGSGFYLTDYRSDRYKKDAKAEKEVAQKSGAKPGGDGSPSKSGCKPTEGAKASSSKNGS